MSNDAIMALNLPTGIPFVYELDENMKPVKPMQVNETINDISITNQQKNIITILRNNDYNSCFNFAVFG